MIGAIAVTVTSSGVVLYGYPFRTAMANNTHAAIQHAPPNGVIAPSARMPVKVIAYSEPEKITMPAMKSQPLALTKVPGHRDAAQATAMSARAWYI